MGIFEKSIPKYVINPIEQNAQVAPQPYVVDDIFDPIFNANVRNALRQKYGSSLAGVGGGYAELLENAWGGDTGIFGKGMGVLSTFGRSMEKADDLVLGLLTEGVEGISGQGFDNPFKEIFVNDVDYTGKRFLASTANIGRNLVGTTVDESDFGTAWNLPSLGIELGTDVGILGGGLARKFAPTAKDFTSKQLFERLGKSDLKTTVGEVGQLMSNYDDLMAKVAIDVTAPGLRPAFKSLMNKIATLIPHSSPNAYADYFKRKASGVEDGSDDTLPESLLEMYANLDATYKELPVSPAEVFAESDRMPSAIMSDVVQNGPSNRVRNMISQAEEMYPRRSDVEEVSNAVYNHFHPAVGTAPEAAVEATPWDAVDIGYSEFDKGLGDAVAEVANRAAASGVDVSDIRIDRTLGPVSENLNDVRQLIKDTFLTDYADSSLKAPLAGRALPDTALTGELTSDRFGNQIVLRDMFPHEAYDLEQSYAALLAASDEPLTTPPVKGPRTVKVNRTLNDLVHRTDAEKAELNTPRKEALEHLKSGTPLGLYLYDTWAKHIATSAEKDKALADFMAAQRVMNKSGLSVNRTYVNDLIDRISTDEGLLEALETGVWSDNEAVNNLVNAVVFGSKGATNPIVKSYNSLYTVSPSEFARLDKAGVKGILTSKQELKKALPFETADEFDEFFESDEMGTALNALFPPIQLDKHTRAQDFGAFDDLGQIERVSKFKEVLKKVAFPPENVSVKDYNKSLKELVDYVDKYMVTSGQHTLASEILEAVPEQATLLNNLYNVLDNIQTHHLQPLQNLPRRSLDFTGRRAEDFFQTDINDYGIYADYGSYDAFAQALFSKLAPYITDEDSLRHYYEPLAPYMELKFKKNSAAYIRPDLVKSYEDSRKSLETVYDKHYGKSKGTVKRFYTEVLPIFEEYVVRGGNIHAKYNLPSGFDKKKYDKLRAYFGKDGVEADPDADAFHSILENVFPGYWKKESVSRKPFKAKYPETDWTADKSKNPLLDIGQERSTDIYNNAKFLTEHIVTPSGVSQILLRDSYTGRAPIKDSNLVNEVYSTVAKLRNRLADIGIRSEAELAELLRKSGVDSENLDTIRKQLPTLTTLERRKLEAYAILYETHISELPYHAIRRNRASVAPETGFPLLHRAIKHDLSISDIDPAAKDVKLHPRVDGHLTDLLSREQDWHFAKNGYASELTKYSSPGRILLSDLLDEYGTHVYRNSVAENFPKHIEGEDVALMKKLDPNYTPILNEVPTTSTQLSDFIKRFEAAKAVDDKAAHDFNVSELRRQYYIRSKGKSYKRPVREFNEAKDKVTYEFFGKPYKDVAADIDIDGWKALLDEYREAEALDAARAARLSEARAMLPTESAYSPANKAYVEKHLIPRLPYRYQIAWKPSPSRGLFYFEIFDDEPVAAMHIGDTFEIHLGDFQRKFRSGMTYADIMKLPEQQRPLSNYIDYLTLQTVSGFDKTAKRLADKSVQMPYFKNPKRKLADVALDALKTPEAFENAVKPADVVVDAIVKAPPEEVADIAFEAPSIAETAVEAAVKEVVGDEAYKVISENGDPDSAREIVGEDVWRLKEQIAKASAVPNVNATRKTRSTLRSKRAHHALNRAEQFKLKYLALGGKFSDFRRFAILRQQPAGDVVRSADFWEEFRKAGMFEVTAAKGSADAERHLDALTYNAELINKTAGHDIVRVVSEDASEGKVKTYIQFISDKHILGYIDSAADALEKAEYRDVIFSPPKALDTVDLDFMNSEDMRELSEIMKEAQELAADQAKCLGFQFDSTNPYTKHAMLRNPENAEWFESEFYSKTSSEDLDAIVAGISNLDRYRSKDHGAFGTTVQTRRFRGDTWMLDDGPKYRFNYDPYEVVTSTLADGAFANLQYQCFNDILINDNFKIKEYFRTTEELKDLFYKPLADGRPSGNLRNLELCAARYDEDGKIVGITKYDKTSEAGLARALANPDTVIAPANIVAYIDSVLRKDVRMSNKFLTFINSHFTIPFKFGLLSNPGFLLGNVSDSTFKIATTMSEKYGTPLTEEAANVAKCMRQASTYKSNYIDAFGEWREVSKAFKIKLSPEARIPDIVAMSPKHNEKMLDWLAGRLRTEVVKETAPGKFERVEIPVPCNLTENVKNAASTWILLQTMQMGTNKLRDLSDAAGLYTASSKFVPPTNVWDRILKGRGKYDPKDKSTWGLVMNNPPMNAMRKMSEGWEDVIRTASILDDLNHSEYTAEEVGRLARGLRGTEEDTLFRARLDEAKSTMYNAQFDYERQSDFTDAVGTAIPFPIFFLKNFAYWMELFMENPQFVDNVIDVQEGLWAGHNEKDDKFMKEAKGRGAIPVQSDALPNWFKGVYKPSPLQSMFGAFNLLNSPLDNLTYRVNPLVSGATSVIGQATGDPLTTLSDSESIKYRPYSTDMYERNIKLGDEEFNPIDYTAHRMNPFDRSMNAWLRAPSKMKEGEFQLSDALPSVFQPIF